MRLIGRQGDVLLFALDAGETVEGESEMHAEARGDRGTVLAHGEVTGHAHAIRSRDAKLYRRSSAEVTAQARAIVADALLVARRAVVLRHEEHGPVRIPPGRVLVRIQREYSPQEMRSAAD